MGLNRRCCQPKLLGQSLRGETLRHSTEDLHLTRCQSDRSRLAQWRSFGYPPKNLWNHLSGYRALAAESSLKRPLQLTRAGVLQNIARTAGLHHPQEIVARLRYGPSDYLGVGIEGDDLFCGCGPVHLRHVDVHQNEVRFKSSHGSERLGPRRGFATKAQAGCRAQHRSRGHTRQGAVIDYKHLVYPAVGRILRDAGQLSKKGMNRTLGSY